MSTLYKWLRNVRMNYSSEQTNIAHRMIQEQGGWDLHQTITKEIISTAVDSQKPKSIRILGSGWLFDVPIEYLIEKCERVVLSDIYHPRQVMNRYSRYSNVIFETADLTNGIVDLAYNIKKRNFSSELFLSSIQSLPTESYSDDLVVSVNLLSQLSVFITDFLKGNVRISYDQLFEIAEVIQRNHIQNLPKERSLLISDFEEEYLDERGKLLGTKPTVFVDIHLKSRIKEWTWQFDSQMTYREDCKTNLKVVAVKI